VTLVVGGEARTLGYLERHLGFGLPSLLENVSSLPGAGTYNQQLRRRPRRTTVCVARLVTPPVLAPPAVMEHKTEPKEAACSEVTAALAEVSVAVAGTSSIDAAPSRGDDAVALLQAEVEAEVAAEVAGLRAEVAGRGGAKRVAALEAAAAESAAEAVEPAVRR